MAIIGNIIDLIEEDLGAHVRKSGKWFFWHCPFHTDKTPSLGANTVDNRWFCFSCKRGGASNAWIKQHRKRKPAPGSMPFSSYVLQPTLPPDNNQPPNEIWQIRALTLIAEWQGNLWWRQGQDYRWYLYGRGLKGNIMEQCQLGFNPNDRYEPSDFWGLTPETPKDRSVWIPAGICIPWIVDGIVWRINIRRFEKTPKYLQVKDSKQGVFGIDTLKDHPVVFMVEGEFDAMLLEQEAGDLIGVCTLGSASNRCLDARWLSYFLGCHKVVLVGDSDNAGEDWALAMGLLSKRMCRTIVPTGKDLTEYWKKGGDLRKWVEWVLGEIPNHTG
jgi:DNA primase